MEDSTYSNVTHPISFENSNPTIFLFLFVFIFAVEETAQHIEQLLNLN